MADRTVGTQCPEVGGRLKPQPVGAKSMRLLHQIGGGLIDAWWQVSAASRLFERLRRSGYVEFSECGCYARITAAGRALLERA